MDKNIKKIAKRASVSIWLVSAILITYAASIAERFESHSMDSSIKDISLLFITLALAAIVGAAVTTFYVPIILFYMFKAQLVHQNSKVLSMAIGLMVVVLMVVLNPWLFVGGYGEMFLTGKISYGLVLIIIIPCIVYLIIYSYVWSKVLKLKSDLKHK